MSLHARGRSNFWRAIPPLTLVLALVGTALPACKESAPPAPAPAPPPAVVPAPPPPAPAPPPPAPPPSALGAALLAIADADGFRALAADDFRLVENRGKAPSRTLVKLPGDRIDAKLFDHKIKARLPREPDPAGGEGEDFRCDDAQRSCVFSDETGRATTYLFAAPPGGSDPPKLREIQVGAAPR